MHLLPTPALQRSLWPMQPMNRLFLPVCDESHKLGILSLKGEVALGGCTEVCRRPSS